MPTIDCRTGKILRDPLPAWGARFADWLVAHPRFEFWLSAGIAIAVMAWIGIPAVWDGAHKWQAIAREVR